MKGICLKSWQIKALQQGRLKELLVPINQQPIDVLTMNGDLRGVEWIGLVQKEPPKGILFRCRYGNAGDRLFVKEIFAIGNSKHYWGSPIYKATFNPALKPICEGFTPWRSAVTMTKDVSRFTLEIEKVSVIRVQNVTDKQAKAMGFEWDERLDYYTDGTPSRSLTIWSPVDVMKEQWDKDHKNQFQWSGNPWCWNLKVNRVNK